MPEVSPAVIKRLPRYFRYLREVIRQGKTRVSSAELSKMMNVTASQIRQDLNCFGGFGQQGYGYNVNFLYTKICEILGVGCGFRALVIGAGNLGSALVKSSMFDKRGVDVVAMVDVRENIIGKTIGDVTVYKMDDLEELCEKFEVDIVILTLPKENATAAAQKLLNTKVKGIWNFTGKELDLGDSHIVVENEHIGDSLMTLCYEIARREEDL
ncbi:MAG: redox-sensing transcriptional repressor Rex [Clostridia bacterium]|nr:redox-sensing transcriptional repressor Rex [Clostridia bacterium]